jgi:hypothetical protein
VATADTVLHDSVRREFSSSIYDRALRRRFAVPQNGSEENPRSWAAVYDQQLYLTLASGRLHVFDLAGGTSTGYVEFPQPLQQAVALDPRGRVLYQVADDGVVYTLATADLRVLESGVLGESGDATTPPFCVGSYLLLFERRGDVGRMLVYAVTAKGCQPVARLYYVRLSPVRRSATAAVDLAAPSKCSLWPAKPISW